MKYTGFLKASLLILFAALLIAFPPVQNGIFAKNTINTEIAKKHKHKHKYSSKKKPKSTTGNRTTENKSGSNEAKDNKNTENNPKTNKK